MAAYRNVLEDILELEFDEMTSSLNICTCPQCRTDIIAYALNQLPPRYVATQAGMVLSKADLHEPQKHTDIQAALARAIDLVAKQPHH